MNRMKSRWICALLVVLATASVCSATVITTGLSAPTSDVFLSHESAENNTLVARRGYYFGQTFELANAASLDAVTLRISSAGPYTFSGGDAIRLFLRVDTNGDGVTDDYADSGRDFQIADGTTYNDNEYITFDLETVSWAIEANKAYRIGMRYSAGADDESIGFYASRNDFAPLNDYANGSADQNLDGGANTSIYDTTFYLQGTAFPEPATLGLVSVFGGAILLIRRRLRV